MLVFINKEDIENPVIQAQVVVENQAQTQMMAVVENQV
jgi:hypothetical protein